MLMMREKWRREMVPEARLNNASIPGKLAYKAMGEDGGEQDEVRTKGESLLP